MRTFTLLAVLVALAALASARPQDEVEYYDDEAAPAPSSTTARPVAASRGRGLASLRKPAVGKKVAPEPTSTTTTTTAAPASAEYEDEEPQEESAPAVEEPTTKKYLIAGRNGVVRPFRSNDELLAALKRRRSQTAVSTHAPPNKNDEEPTEAPAKPSKSNKNNGRTNNLNSVPRKRFSPVQGHVAVAPVVSQSVDSPTPAPRARNSNSPSFTRRANQNRSRVQEEQLAAEDAEESQQQDEAPSSARPSRSFSPRRRS